MAVLAVDEGVGIPDGLQGRAIVHIALALIGFWSRHRSTLAPVIDSRLTTVLDSLSDAINLVKQIAKPGPE